MVPIEDAEITFQIPFVDFLSCIVIFKLIIDRSCTTKSLMILSGLLESVTGLVEYCAVILAWCPSKKS
jgi:hypothetical protein